MNILIVGGGGREHALAWKAAQSPQVGKIYVAPGNAGTAREAKTENVAIAAEDVDALAAFARAHHIDLTIVGPETPLILGIVDRFTESGLRCFGPDRRAAALEGSKSFAKDFLARHGIPTAAHGSFTELSAARDYIEKNALPIVVKADGLAAGKGVVVARRRSEALRAVEDMLSGRSFGSAGQRVVIEEFLPGEEASFIVLCDGRTVLPLASCQDHKARDDGDLGPNTGGMGAYSPAPVVTPEIHQRVLTQIIEPTVLGMRKEGNPYLGCLYAGLMIPPDGTPRLLEFNCRFGDPEAQPIFMRLKTDLVRMCLHALEGTLHECAVTWDARAALSVVLAAEGYPAQVRRGDVISGLEEELPDGVKIFHAGTAERDGSVVTAGGRVLSVTALAADIAAARRLAYAAVGGIRWRGMFYRRDIGYRALTREQQMAGNGTARSSN